MLSPYPSQPPFYNNTFPFHNALSAQSIHLYIIIPYIKWNNIPIHTYFISCLDIKKAGKHSPAFFALHHY